MDKSEQNIPSISPLSIVLFVIMLSILAFRILAPEEFNFFSCTNFGYLSSFCGDNVGAVKDFTEAIALNPRNYVGYCNRGEAYRKLGDTNAAIKDFTSAISLNPKYAAAYFSRGYLRWKLRDDIGALNDFCTVIDLDPNNNDAYYYRGLLRLERFGKTQLALKDFDRLIKLSPSNPLYCRYHGETLYKLGDKEGALNDFNRACSLSPEFIELCNKRGMRLQPKVGSSRLFRFRFRGR